MDTLIQKTRDTLEDNLKSNSEDPDVFEYTTSDTFKLSEGNIDESTLEITLNGTALGSGEYSYNSSTGEIDISASLTVGDIIIANYSYYKYSDTEVSGYIRLAFTYLAVYKYKVFTDRVGTYFPTPTVEEEYLIALVASITVKPSLQSYRASDISFVFTDKQSKTDKIRDAINQFRKRYGVMGYHELTNIEDETIED